MNVDRMKEIEKKLQHMIISANKFQNKNQQTKSKSSGAKVIRRRKGLPDLKIL